MEEVTGSARLGLWFVHVRWSGTTVYQVRFSRTAAPGPVPVPVGRYLAGLTDDLSGLAIGAAIPGAVAARIYGLVRSIPYGTTATYGEIASLAGTSPRVVGQAMRRNPVPLLIPCHRVVSRDGPGGFTPDPGIKLLLLDLEKKNRRCFRGSDKGNEETGSVNRR